MTTKGSGPGKTLCDTEEMSVDLQLRLIDFKIGGISAGAGGAGGHRGAILLVLALAGEYFGITSGGPDAPRPVLE